MGLMYCATYGSCYHGSHTKWFDEEQEAINYVKGLGGVDVWGLVYSHLDGKIVFKKD